RAAAAAAGQVRLLDVRQQREEEALAGAAVERTECRWNVPRDAVGRGVVHRLSHLRAVVLRSRAASRLADFLDGGDEQPDQDGDYDEQLNEREGGRATTLDAKHESVLSLKDDEELESRRAERGTRNAERALGPFRTLPRRNRWRSRWRKVAAHLQAFHDGETQ